MQTKILNSTNAVLTKSIGRNANYNFIIDADVDYNEGDFLLITSHSAGYAICKVIAPDNSFVIDGENNKVTFDETKTRYNGNRAICKLEFKEIDLLNQKNNLMFNLEHFDATLEAIFKLINKDSSSDLTVINEKLNVLLNEATENKTKIALNYQCHTAIDDYLFKYSENCLHGLFFDGEKIFIEKINLRDDLNDIYHTSKYVKCLMIVEEITDKDNLIALKKNYEIYKIKEKLEKHQLLLSLFNTNEMQENIDVKEFAEILDLKVQLLNLLKTRNI